MNKAVFLDRDGTINPDPGYISNPDDFNIYEGVAESLARLKKAGYLLVLITNQSGISRGLISTEPTLQDWSVGRSQRIQSGFYTSHAQELHRP